MFVNLGVSLASVLLGGIEVLPLPLTLGFRNGFEEAAGGGARGEVAEPDDVLWKLLLFTNFR